MERPMVQHVRFAFPRRIFKSSANTSNSQAGTVQLSYWPTDTNYSYPATVYDSQLDYTL